MIPYTIDEITEIFRQFCREKTIWVSGTQGRMTLFNLMPVIVMDEWKGTFSQYVSGRIKESLNRGKGIAEGVFNLLPSQEENLGVLKNELSQRELLKLSLYWKLAIREIEFQE